MQLPSCANVISFADIHDRTAFAMVTKMKEEPMDIESLDNNKDEVNCMDHKMDILPAILVELFILQNKSSIYILFTNSHPIIFVIQF